MAFGMEFGGDWGKLGLSLFRIVFVVFMASFLLKLIRKNADKVLIVSLSLVLAGAVGNIIDGTLYGILFSESYRQLATFLPEAGRGSTQRTCGAPSCSVRTGMDTVCTCTQFPTMSRRGPTSPSL